MKHEGCVLGLGKRRSKNTREMGCESSYYVWRLVIGSVWLNHISCARRLRWKQRLGSETGLGGITL